jgi:hypothetical protein
MFYMERYTFDIPGGNNVFFQMNTKACRLHGSQMML